MTKLKQPIIHKLKSVIYHLLPKIITKRIHLHNKYKIKTNLNHNKINYFHSLNLNLIQSKSLLFIILSYQNSHNNGKFINIFYSKLISNKKIGAFKITLYLFKNSLSNNSMRKSSIIKITKNKTKIL